MKYFIAIVACLALLLAVAAFFRSASPAGAEGAAAVSAARPAVAGVQASCFPSGTSKVKKWFNSVTGVKPTITPATGPARCTINFGFDLKTHLFSVASTAVDGSVFLLERTGAQSVTVYPRDVTSGDSTWGTVYLLVY
jgi:hypothetical protein